MTLLGKSLTEEDPDAMEMSLDVATCFFRCLLAALELVFFPTPFCVGAHLSELWANRQFRRDADSVVLLVATESICW